MASRNRLGGLVMEGATFLRLPPLDTSAGAELLTRTVGDPRVSRDPSAAARLVDLCGGYPLALSIASGILTTRSHWDIARLVQNLTDEPRRLTNMTLEKDLSLTAVFDDSYRQLDADTARAYRLLGLIPGPDFTAALAAVVLNHTEPDAEELLEALVEASLLETRDGQRYRFHDVLRAHAQQRAEQEEESTVRDSVLDRVLGHYLKLAAIIYRTVMPREWRAGPIYEHLSNGPAPYSGTAEALDALEPELLTIMASLHDGLQGHRDDLVWQVAEALWPLFLYRQHFAHWVQTYQWGVEAATRCGHQVALSRMHRQLGMAYHNQGQNEEAIKQGTLALAAATVAGHGQAESSARSLIGLSYRDAGRIADAVALFRDAIASDHEAERRRSEALNWRRLGQAQILAGDLAEAIASLRHAQAQAIALGEPIVEAMTTVHLVDALSRDGQYDKAADLLMRVSATIENEGSAQYSGVLLWVRGEHALRVGEPDLARSYLAQAHLLFDSHGIRRHANRVAATLALIDPPPENP
ncbi:MAG: tetratricopeptide repeat protein [Actinophytocola sp.]